MSPGPGQRVDLRAAARRDAIGIAIAGVIAVVASPVVLAVGSVLLIGLILGPLLLIAGLLAIPYGIYRAAFPMTHHALRELGATDAERHAAIAAIESDLVSALSVRLASGAILSVTPRHFVARGRDLVIARREDLLWAYGKVTTHKRYGFTTGKSNDVCVVTRRTGEHTFSSRDAQETASALALLAQASPRAFVGYRDDLAALGRDRLAAQVDRIPFTSGDAWPDAYPAGVPEPSTSLSQPRASTAPPRSNALSWALLLGGGALAGGGLLSAALFGWIASHPQQPDDVRFGSFCSISSVVVCLGPGAIATAFAVWRFFVRAQQRGRFGAHD